MFDFAKELKDYLQREFITGEKDWSIKGFIDAKKKIYPISLDTKLLSKILELTILPLLIDFSDGQKRVGHKNQQRSDPAGYRQGGVRQQKRPQKRGHQNAAG